MTALLERRRVAGLVVFLAGVLAAASLGTATARARILTVAGGRKLALLPPRTAKHEPLGRAQPTFTSVQYLGGPVMPGVEAVLVFMEPKVTVAGAKRSAQPFPPGYREGIEAYFADLAAQAKAGITPGSAADNTVTAQYDDGEGAFANFAITVAPPVSDEPELENGCASGEICLRGEQVVEALQRYIERGGLAGGFEREFLVILPPKVVVCFKESSPSKESCSPGAPETGFCAYHSFFTIAGAPYIYAVSPYDAEEPACLPPDHPLLHPGEAAVAGGIAHELLESVTDPIVGTGWLNAEAAENGAEAEVADRCAEQFGEPLGLFEGAVFNQLLNGVPYYYQEVWSNFAAACLQRLGQLPNGPLPEITGRLAGLKGELQAGEGASRYFWNVLPGEGVTVSAREGRQVTVQFPAAGRYVVSVTEYREGGASLALSALVKVREGETSVLPQAAIAGPTKVKVGEAATYTASLASPGLANNLPQQPKAYIWWLSGNPSDGGGEVFTARFPAPGTYYLTVGIETSAGEVVHRMALVEAKREQTVQFLTAPPSQLYVGQSYQPRAQASSGAPIAFSTSGSCALEGEAVRATSPGTCTVIASQEGNGEYFPARASQSFSVVAQTASLSQTTTTTTSQPAPGRASAGRLQLISLRRLSRRRLLIRFRAKRGAQVRVVIARAFRWRCRRRGRRCLAVLTLSATVRATGADQAIRLALPPTLSGALQVTLKAGSQRVSGRIAARRRRRGSCRRAATAALPRRRCAGR